MSRPDAEWLYGTTRVAVCGDCHHAYRSAQPHDDAATYFDWDGSFPFHLQWDGDSDGNTVLCGRTFTVLDSGPGEGA